MKEPNFFIIGAPKCGTTALATYLADHPGVFITNPKEPHHYNTDLNHGSYKEVENYYALYSQVTERHKAVGEASVWYLYSKTAVPNILEDFPDAKFIVMLRNPIEMAPSLHEQMIFSGYEDVLSFEEAWELQDKRRYGKRVPLFCAEPSLLQYKDACSLGSQYERLCSQVDEKRICAIVFDDFKADSRLTWKKVLNFLEVDYEGRKEFPVINSAKKRKSLLIKKVNDVYSGARRWAGIPGLGTGFFASLNKWNKKEIVREFLPIPVSEMLKKEFREEVQLLSKLIDRDLSHWVR